MESQNYEIGGEGVIDGSIEPFEPELAPLEVVAEFRSEADALRYSIDHIRKLRPGLTQGQLADEMRLSRANLSKVLQEQAAIPKDSHAVITKHTRCLALAQYRNLDNRLVTKTIRREREERELLKSLKDENAALRDELENVKSKYHRVIGE